MSIFLIFYSLLDTIIWQCNVYDAIIPALCRLHVRAVRLEVKLRKRKTGIKWTTLYDEKVCMFIHNMKEAGPDQCNKREGNKELHFDME